MESNRKNKQLPWQNTCGVLVVFLCVTTGPGLFHISTQPADTTLKTWTPGTQAGPLRKPSSVPREQQHGSDKAGRQRFHDDAGGSQGTARELDARSVCVGGWWETNPEKR